MAQPHLRVVRREHSLVYAMRLFPDETLPEMEHQRVEITVPGGDTETLTLHVINGDKEAIKRQLLESIDAFFEIYVDPER